MIVRRHLTVTGKSGKALDIRLQPSCVSLMLASTYSTDETQDAVPMPSCNTCLVSHAGCPWWGCTLVVERLPVCKAWCVNLCFFSSFVSIGCRNSNGVCRVYMQTVSPDTVDMP